MQRALSLLLGGLVLGALGYLALGQPNLPEGPGRDLVLAKCQTCHGLDLVAGRSFARERWDSILEEMTSYGLRLTPEERKAILDYLATYLGPEPPPAAPIAQAPPKTGAQVYANCQGCHGAQGEGNPPTFPPLKGHVETLLKAGGRTYLIAVTLYGLQGPIQVQGQAYQGVMPGFAWLSDEDLALLLNHLLAWGAPKDTPPFTLEEIQKVRSKPLSPEEVYRLRQGLGLP